MEYNNLRKFQHIPGTYPLNTCLWRESFHIWTLGYMGYVPGVCWNFLRSKGFDHCWHESRNLEASPHSSQALWERCQCWGANQPLNRLWMIVTWGILWRCLRMFVSVRRDRGWLAGVCPPFRFYKDPNEMYQQLTAFLSQKASPAIQTLVWAEGWFGRAAAFIEILIIIMAYYNDG